MLTLSREYLHLLQASGQPLAQTYNQHFPPIALAPYSYALLGRLSSMSTLRHSSTLLDAVRTVNVKTAQKKAQSRAAASGNPAMPLAVLAEPVAAVTSAANNTPWMHELTTHVAKNPTEPIRYICLEDPLHTNVSSLVGTAFILCVCVCVCVCVICENKVCTYDIFVVYVCVCVCACGLVL